MPRPRKSAVTENGLNEKAGVVLHAATKLFMQHGFAATTTDMVQRAAGVSKSTIYAHYPTKELLFFAVVEAECERLNEPMVSRAPLNNDIAGFLVELGQTYLDLILAPKALALYRLSVAESVRFPEIGALFYKSGPGRGIAAISAALTEAEKAGLITFHDLPVTFIAEQFAAQVRGYTRLRALSFIEDSQPVKKKRAMLAKTVQMFLKAYGTPHPSRTR